MCTKSKTSFGCGHCVKVINECGIAGCTNVAKYKMPDKDCDCAECKSAGTNTTRGREGRGRYARKTQTPASRQSSFDSLPPDSPHLTISPWLPADPLDSKEKKWIQPTRRQADDAWIIEHERRMSDLDEKTSKMSLSSHHGTYRRSRRSSSRSSYEQVIEADEVEEPEEIEHTPSKARAIKMLPYEISEDSDKSRSRRQICRTSYNSHYVMSYHPEAPVTPRRRIRVVPLGSEHDLYQAPQPMANSHGRGSKTEPYRRHPQSCLFDSSVSGSPIVRAHRQGHHEIDGHPLQHDAYYPRQHTVY